MTPDGTARRQNALTVKSGVVTIDIETPAIPGTEELDRIMAERPTTVRRLRSSEQVSLVREVHMTAEFIRINVCTIDAEKRVLRLIGTSLSALCSRAHDQSVHPLQPSAVALCR